MRGDAAGFDHNLDRIVDAILGVTDRGRQIVERESVGMDLGGVETLLRQESLGAVRCAFAFAADAIEVNVVAHDMGDVDRRFGVRERRQAHFAAAIDHIDRLVHRVRRAGAFDDIIDAFTAVEPLDRLDDIFIADIDNVIGAELAADLQPIVARAGEDDRLRAQGLRHRYTKKTDRSGTGDDNALAGNEAAELGEPVHCRAGGDDQGRLLVRHRVGNGDERIDVIDLIFAEAPVGGETVGAVTLVDLAVIEAVVVARGVHAFAAALALAAAGMNFDRDALAYLVFVDARTERDHRAHIFVARREVLVERLAALDERRRPVIDDFKIGGADRHRVDANENLGALGHRDWLLRQLQLTGIAEYPGFHGVGDREILVRFHPGPAIHDLSFRLRLPS